MNSAAGIITARKMFYVVLAMAALLLLLLAPKAAVNVDEQLHYPHAKRVVNWYFTGGADKSCLDTPVTNLKYYGQSVDNITALINRVFGVKNEFLTRHFTGAFFFWLLLVFSGLVAYQYSSSYWVSVFTVILIMAMPRLFGHAFGNLKDIPFATGYLAGIYYINRYLNEMPAPKWKSAVFLGLSIAFTSSVRIGGLILFGYLGLVLIAYFISRPFLLKQIFTTKLSIARLLGQGMTILLIGYFAGLLFWPFALQDVFAHPLESLRVMEHYKVSIRQVFEGDWIWSTNLPWHYLPKWLMISTPEIIFTGFGVFLFLFLKKINKQNSKQLFNGLFLLFALFFPLIYVIIIDANLYSGVRQMIFVLPLLAVFASAGLVELYDIITSKTFKKIVLVFCIVLLILPVKHQLKSFPADYIYFNTISGGNKAAWANFEYDYYFHCIKEPAEYLIQLTGNNQVSVAMNCNLPNYFKNYKNISYKYSRYLERSQVDWDYGLFGLNYIHPELLKNGKWQSEETIKTFYHAGNPVVVLLKRKDKTDYLGIEKSLSGQMEEARELLEKAAKSDPNNVLLYLQLAKNALKQSDFESFNTYLQCGRNIYPQYEPFYLLEAQALFDKGLFREAKIVMNTLLEINPRYDAAAPLLRAINGKF